MVKHYLGGTLLAVGGAIAVMAGIWVVMRMMEKDSDLGGEPAANWIFGATDIWLIVMFRHWRIKDDGIATGVCLMGVAIALLGWLLF